MEVVAIAFAISVAFILGWEISVRRFNRRRRHERAYLAALESEVSDRLAGDEMRAGIDTGKDYAVMRMQDTINDIRSERP